ncbi:TPA: hypothetical protein U2E55_001184 [Streptococcus suis]|uniref:hypothetical protein n=1 Tax=Streptococcus suis TaxID=1307 RepID=UPI002AAE1B53|nr:hypothetical protein [Streptococcus suis]HEM5287636.1 hypothetical protein [Streptococcus suis]HEM5297714.1 hypothetical protein [Streptococcus suis]HEM6244842.1 hypothetical protein [Streptococcus suis]HEM6556804.1 hypothetical protein [Streptococcus suis]
MIIILSKTILLAIIWYLSILLFAYFKRKADFYNGKVVNTSNLLAYSFQVLANQFTAFLRITKVLLNKIQLYIENEHLILKKEKVLVNTKNHINLTLEKDLGLNTTQPATTGGIDVWVYLANKLDSATETKLENYFSGVLSKYTQEFALDILVIEQIAGAGWVAKFDVKPVAEAQYNRMARASEVVQEEKFDEDLDIW